MKTTHLLPFLLLVACSSSSATGPTDASTSSPKDVANERDPQKNCIKPGTPNNDKGLGGYCEPGDYSCVSDVGVALCTGMFGAPDDQWFCTKGCLGDDDCGKGMYCDKSDPRGSGCVPNVCGTPPSASDAGLDAHHD